MRFGQTSLKEWLQIRTWVESAIEEKDYQPLDGAGTPLALHAGELAIFFPQDAHLPGQITGEPRHVRKTVVKVPTTLRRAKKPGQLAGT